MSPVCLISDICPQSALCWSHGDYNAWCVGRRGMRHLEGQLHRPSEIPYPKLCQTSGRFSHTRTAGESIKPSGRANLASYSKLAPSRSTLIGYAHWPAPGLQRIFGPFPRSILGLNMPVTLAMKSCVGLHERRSLVPVLFEMLLRSGRSNSLFSDPHLWACQHRPPASSGLRLTHPISQTALTLEVGRPTRR